MILLLLILVVIGFLLLWVSFDTVRTNWKLGVIGLIIGFLFVVTGLVLMVRVS